MQVYRFTCI